MRTLAAVTLAGLAASITAALGAAAAEPPRETKQPHLEVEFYAAIGAGGQTYRQFRDRILERGPAAEKFLTDRARNGKTWQERTMAWILLERFQKKAQVEALLDAKPGVPYHRNLNVRIPRYSDALAAKAKATPLVLVENVWKGNRLLWDRFPMVTTECAVVALGILKERRATPVLIDYLQRHLTLVTGQQSSHTLGYACTALGSLAQPQAVPILLLTCLANPRMSAGDESLRALEECVDMRTLGLLRSEAIYPHVPWLKKQLPALVKKKEAEFAARRMRETRNE